MGEQPPIPAPRLPAEQADLYCLECGYNLRGLSGDPCRCPECGTLNPVDDSFIPAKLVLEQLSRMEKVGLGCMIASVGALSAAVALVFQWPEPSEAAAV